MKKLILSIAAFALIALSNQSIAQTEKKREIKKEVNMEEVNGVKTLTIKTTENGETKKEVYKGDEADKKMKELHNTKSGSTKTMVVGDDGQKHMKIEKRVVIKEEKETTKEK